MSDEVTIIKSGRGTVLLCEGYRFHKHVQNKNGTSLWRCEHYKKSKLNCTGSVSLNSDKRIISRRAHCNACEPDVAHNCIESTISDYCNEASHGKEPAPRIYKKALAIIESKGWHFSSSKPVPTFDQKKSGIYRQRNKLAHVKKNKSNSPEEVEIPKQYEDFLLADYLHNGMRIIVFSSKDARMRLKLLTNYFMDGTYQSCPKPFRQLYVIQADIGSDSNSTNIVPLVFAFMTHQTTEAYTVLFNLIKAQIPDWQPKTVTIDFEKATMLALSRIDVEIHGCHYHFSNALYRKAKTLGIKLTKNNRRIISLCSKLALLPESNIEDGWDYIKREISQNEDKLSNFVNYFQKYWMNDHYYKIWCVYGLRHRTNNSIEGWNHNINTNINKNEVQLLQILHILHQESSLASLNCDRWARYKKRSSPKRRKLSVQNDNCILFAQMQLANGEIGIGHFLEKLR